MSPHAPLRLDGTRLSHQLAWLGIRASPREALALGLGIVAVALWLAFRATRRAFRGY